MSSAESCETVSLGGQVILVTGGAKGLGRRVAERAAMCGASVVVNCVSDLEAADAVASSIEQHGGRAIALRSDVTEPSQVASMIDEASGRLGPITSVVHCAAFRSSHQPITEIAFDDWTRAVEVALDGAFLCATATLPSMLAKQFGRFVFIGGSASHTGRPEGSTHGAAAKAGLDGLARSIAQEFGQDGIIANVVVPGALDTPRTRELDRVGTWSPTRTNTIRRLIRLDEVAALCIHLSSEFAAATNGARLLVDGGLMAR